MGFPNRLKKERKTHEFKETQREMQEHMPNAEEVAKDLGKATSIDDFYGRDGIFAK